MTKFPDLFAALAAPFESREVRTRKQAGRDLAYVTARTVMNRLDNIFGPENWWDDYTPGANSVLCRLTVRLPDGSTLTKADAGGYAGMSDSGDDDKSGYSDAFKRAAVKFGVGRYLYGDGVPSYYPGEVREASASGPRHDRQDAPRRDPGAKPNRNPDTSRGEAQGGDWTGKQLFRWAHNYDAEHGTKRINDLAAYGKAHGFPARIVDWDAEQVKAAYRAIATQPVPA